MIEFETTNEGPVFVQPEHVEAVETAPEGLMRVARSKIKVVSGKDYEVEGTPQEVVRKLFPVGTNVRRTSTLGV